MSKSRETFKYYLLLHLIILIYSFGAIASKLASQQAYFSMQFFGYYFLSLFSLVVYAVLWQIILKKISLTVAFLNKSVVIFWTMLWGRIIFKEEITWNMLLGTVIVCFGLSWVVTAGES